MTGEWTEQALAAAGFRAGGRTTSGGVLGIALDGSGRVVELEVLRVDEPMRSRLAALRDLRHDHLSRVLEVVELDTVHVGVFVEHTEGTTLERLAGSRAPLREGEAVTVAVPVAQALAALHAAGLAHGAVSARNVVLDRDGRPVLTGALGALRGTASPRDDVRAALAMVLAHLETRPPADAEPGGGLRDALEDLLHLDDQGEVVEASRIVDRCFRVCAPSPVGLVGVRRRDPLPTSTVAALRAAPRAGRRAAPGVARRRRTHVAAAGAALVVVVAAGVVVVGGRVAGREPERSAVTASPTASATAAPFDTPAGPSEAATVLTARRAERLASGDAAALADVEVVGGPAHAADVELLTGLGGLALDGLGVTVDRAVQVGQRQGDEARVEVVSTTSRYTLVGRDGVRSAGGPGAQSAVVLVLRWTEAGWRVWDVVEPG